MEKICPHCKNKIINRRKDAKDCGSSKCAATTKRLYYQSHAREIVCKYCNLTFKGKGKRVCCDFCQDKINNLPRKRIIRPVVCKRCKAVFKTEEVYITKKTKITNQKGVCSSCLKQNRENLSERMKLDNPVYNQKLTFEQYQTKLQQKEIDKKQRKQNIIDKMTNHNPMFSEETRNKVRKTIKTKIKNGELKYKTGADHHLYKGNRNINKQVRDLLKEWFVYIKQRDCYTCSSCGKKGGYLHTHHLEPLRSIIKKFNVKKLKGKIKEINNEDLKELCQAIIAYHWENDYIGVTVCESCHGEKR